MITKTRVQDAGKYRCHLKANSSTYYTVAVIVPAFISIEGDEKVVLSRGEDKLLDCGVSNNTYPPARMVYWEHNDRYIADGPTLPVTVMNQSQTDVDIYECIAFNGYGTPASKKFYVSIKNVEKTLLAESTDMVTASAFQVSNCFCLLCVALVLITQGADRCKTYSTCLTL